MAKDKEFGEIARAVVDGDDYEIVYMEDGGELHSHPDLFEHGFVIHGSMYLNRMYGNHMSSCKIKKAGDMFHIKSGTRHSMSPSDQDESVTFLIWYE